ncbi:hydratase [Mesorhizobium sp. CAU 1732]|uniref:2-keto-4-pentenoate hydratase n=1 Tax=Mesorhizobium sp. CAU 1732 TaxID=3140358 RepID=UPI003260CEA7
MSEIAHFILEALDDRRQIAPIVDARPTFGLAEAYAASDAVLAARIARGERPAGWKIGFTNRTIWDEYDVHAPIWGPMYDATIHEWTSVDAPIQLDADNFVEPRIEPEIVFRLARTPRGDMDDSDLIGCIDAVGHGFEIVQSLFPGWRFKAADTVAAFALHGALVHGPMHSIAYEGRSVWVRRLADFRITLSRDGEAVDTGASENVLGGPLSALRHFVLGMERAPMTRGILPGDLVTTGTVTRAFPVKAGETWTTTLDGLPLPGMSLQFAAPFGPEIAIWIERCANARFLFETPPASASDTEYQAAVELRVEAETALSTLLFHDRPALDRARAAVGRKATALANGWRRSNGA